MAADDHFGIEAQAHGRRIAGARAVGRAQRKAVHVGTIERRHIDRRRDIMGKHPGQRARERDRFGPQRCELDMAREARARLLGRDHLEELLLAGGLADGGEQIAPAPTPPLPGSRAREGGCWAVGHGQGLTMTVAPAG
jgi:hypothetical protein